MLPSQGDSGLFSSRYIEARLKFGLCLVVLMYLWLDYRTIFLAFISYNFELQLTSHYITVSKFNSYPININNFAFYCTDPSKIKFPLTLYDYKEM